MSNFLVEIPDLSVQFLNLVRTVCSATDLYVINDGIFKVNQVILDFRVLLSDFKNVFTIKSTHGIVVGTVFRVDNASESLAFTIVVVDVGKGFFCVSGNKQSQER